MKGLLFFPFKLGIILFGALHGERPNLSPLALHNVEVLLLLFSFIGPYNFPRNPVSLHSLSFNNSKSSGDSGKLLVS